MSLSEILVLFLGGCLLIVSCFFLVKNIFVLFLSISSRKWVKTIGTIRTSNLSKYRDENCEQYLAEVEYEYKYGTKKYRSNNLFFGYMMTSNFYYHKSIVERYILGSTVEVYHHPREPELSTLIIGVQTHIMGRLLLFLVMACAGLLMIISVWC